MRQDQGNDLDHSNNVNDKLKMGNPQPSSYNEYTIYGCSSTTKCESLL
jgi:hypothetical protein